MYSKKELHLEQIQNYCKSKRKSETTIRHHITFTKTAKVKKTVTRIGRDVEKLEASYTDGGNVKWCSLCGKQFCRSSKC